jgi:hypothetical protein
LRRTAEDYEPTVVGRIKAAGLTEDGLARMIERRLVELKIIAGP